MPHLEESLRYTTTREKRCLTRQEVLAWFPLLESAALKDCIPKQEDRRQGELSYLLACEGQDGASAKVVWRWDERVMNGSLNVKLGGKNMTAHQRVTARYVGECELTHGAQLR